MALIVKPWNIRKPGQTIPSNIFIPIFPHEYSNLRCPLLSELAPSVEQVHRTLVILEARTRKTAREPSVEADGRGGGGVEGRREGGGSVARHGDR